MLREREEGAGVTDSSYTWSLHASSLLSNLSVQMTETGRREKFDVGRTKLPKLRMKL